MKGLGAAVAVCVGLAAAGARAEEPEFPPGREVVSPRRRPEVSSVPVRVCSFRAPVCVHAGRDVHPAAVLATLADAERALAAYDALRLPRPLADDGLGGSDAFDLYLVRGAASPATSIDLLGRGDPIDRASAFAVLPPPGAREGCFAARDVAHALADAIAFRLDAGLEGGALAMSSSYLASIAAPCANAELAAVDAFQSAPERSLFGGAPGALDGSFLFPALLDEMHGNGTPSSVMVSAIALGRQKTPPGAFYFANEPDVLDVLRVTMKSLSGSLDGLLLDAAVARAFVGSRSDGAHLADVARFGDAGRVRFAWSLPYASLPRRVASDRPVEPTGAAYVWIDLAGAPPDATLTFAADWELPVAFAWALVKVDANGVETGRSVVTAPYGTTRVERSLTGLAGLAGVLVVGTNAGSIDRSEPYDPDGPASPHAWVVTVYR